MGGQGGGGGWDWGRCPVAISQLTEFQTSH